MSTTEELLRALRKTRDLLQTVAGAEHLHPSMRDDAKSCLQRYPDDAVLQAWLDERAPIDAAPWGTAFIESRTILHQLIRALDEDDPLRQQARFAERHFPEPMWLPGGIIQEPWEPVFLDPTRRWRRLGV